MLTTADKGGRGVGEMLTMTKKGGRGGLDPQFLADIICKQPKTHHQSPLVQMQTLIVQFLKLCYALILTIFKTTLITMKCKYFMLILLVQT